MVNECVAVQDGAALPGLMRKQGGSGDCRNALVGLDGGDSAFVSPIQVQPQKIMIACYAFRLGGRHAAWLPIFQQEGAAHPRQDRKSVEQGQRVSVRVDLGGRRIIKKRKIKKN